ncbi:TIGR01212 family radical SAM protein [Prolixibacter bellariivorans]|uniref:TIGR01212 family radical SAM protein n=1 Tax=Prolixibacter bellariivorans TaxID=314319 RepID=A0A5M4AUR8_9BACT|nr:TIGR01212 family radical SAM protein [Prolixibacter bellariivorans]GET31699.1 TIGR01212 family radical SAM protein [Prolixibacter bellariivorans]
MTADAQTNRNFPWGHQRRYNDFPTFFRRKFNERVQKISIDAGFTCPNRDGSRGTGGCTYCNNKTFKPMYCQLENSVTSQLEEGIQFFRKKYESIKFLAYFQAYSNTYAPVKDLRKLYDEALAYPGVIGLVIATRPDCLNNDVLDFLQELSEKYYVMVELGIESVQDRTLEAVNRGHAWEESVRALEETSRRGIHNCAHMILGLPGESRDEILEQADVISRLPVENLKLHQLQIHKGTFMAKQYADTPDMFHLFSVEEYRELVVDYLERLNPHIIVERFVSSAPADLLIAPRWGLKNFEFVAKVEKRLEERDTWQGRLFQKA